MFFTTEEEWIGGIIGIIFAAVFGYIVGKVNAISEARQTYNKLCIQLDNMLIDLKAECICASSGAFRCPIHKHLTGV